MTERKTVYKLFFVWAFEKEEQRSERALPPAVGANDTKLATTWSLFWYTHIGIITS